MAYAVALMYLGLALVGYADRGAETPPGQSGRRCASDNGGIALPEGFCATVFADGLGRARHMAVLPNGDVFVALRGSRDAEGQAGIVALRDVDGDGMADARRQFGNLGGTGIAWRDGHLYFGPDQGVLRYPLPAGSLEPQGPPDTIVWGLPDERSHRAKSLVVTPANELFVNIGAPSNACQVEDRTAGSPGQDPCPELERRAGIWMFDAGATGQRQADGERFATGLRNVVALAYHPVQGALYGVQHGRDQLSQNWPQLFSVEESAELPSEELVRIERGDDFGWPYCYHDPVQGKLVLAPEYGGDGTVEGRCAEKKEPMAAYPAHWGPNGLLFYTGDMFPARYREGAFIAFHGSWNRAPLPQGGYNVVFQPFNSGTPSGSYEIFASGFPGADKSPRGAEHRPSGLAQAPDGSLYISDDSGGRIWRVYYVGG